MNFTSNSNAFHPPLTALAKIFPRGSLLAATRTFQNYAMDAKISNPKFYRKSFLRNASTDNPSNILFTLLKNKSQLPLQDPPNLERSLSDLIAISTTNYFPSSFKKSNTSKELTSVNSFTQFHVYASGKVSETISFEFAPCANRVFYQIGAAKVIVKEFSENVLSQSRFLGAGTGNIVAKAILAHQCMDKLFEEVLIEFVRTGTIRGSDDKIVSIEGDEEIAKTLAIKITVEPEMGNICPAEEIGAVTPQQLFEKGQRDAFEFLETLQTNDLITRKLFYK